MLCNVCNKKVATVHLTEIVDEKIVELHVCQDCAQSKDSLLKGHFDLASFLDAFADEDANKEGPQAVCSHCGLSYHEFKKKSRLGCVDCYRVFRRFLLPLLKRIHGSDKHQGKTPKSCQAAPVSFKAEELKNELKRAVELEEYEKAASLRDQIKRLEEEQTEKTQ